MKNEVFLNSPLVIFAVFRSLFQVKNYFTLTILYSLYHSQTGEIRALLQKRSINAIALPGDRQVECKYIINGNITSIDEGNWHLRFWFGFGAGSAKFEADAKIVDATSNETIGQYKNERISTSYLGRDNILQRVCLELSEDIVKNVRPLIKVQ